MATLAALRKEVEKYNADLIIGDYQPYDQSTRFEIWAPNGFQWSEGTRVFLGYSYRDIKGSKSEAFSVLIDRISSGIVPFKED